MPGASEVQIKNIEPLFGSRVDECLFPSNYPNAGLTQAFPPNYSCVRVKMECLTPYIPPALLPLAEQIQSQTRTLGIAALSLSAVLLGYLFVACSRESPVSFTVSNPPEISDGWTGTKWEDLPEGSEERQIIEGQIRGVSFVQMCTSNSIRQLFPCQWIELTCYVFIAMEREPNYELLPRRRTSTWYRDQACDTRRC